MASDLRDNDNINMEEQDDKQTALDVTAQNTTTIDDNIDSVIDISSDVEYRLNQERTGVQVVKLEKNKTLRKLNSFDLFFVKFWAAIVAAITTVSSAISRGFFKLFKKELPTKYVTAAIAFILIILLIIIILAPFNLTVGEKNVVEIYSNSLIPVSRVVGNETRWGYINKSGREVIPCQFFDAEPFYHNVAFVKVRDESGAYAWRLIGTNGKFKSDRKISVDSANPDKRVVGDFNNKEKRAWIMIEPNKYLYLKTNGESAFGTVPYDMAYSFSNGYALVQKGADWYFISGSGKQKSPEYKKAKSFSEGIAAVKKSSGWTFVNTNFKEITKDSYDAVTSFENGYAWIKNGVAINLIDKKGNIVVKDSLNEGVTGIKPSDKQLKELLEEDLER